MKKPLTIVLTGGGSGGHITPLLSLAHALKKASPNCRIVYIGLKGEELQDRLRERYRIFDEVLSIPAGKFRRYYGETALAHMADLRTLGLNTRDFFRVLSGIKASSRILKQIKPDVVFSKGGFVAVPVGLAAHRQKIPIITHDSDSIPGLANRIIGRYAKVHATGMPANYYNYDPETIRYVGIPVDERIKPVSVKAQAEFKRQLGLPDSSPVLLIGGAGHGAVDVNNTTITIVPELLKRFAGLHVVHITGKKHQSEVEKKYHVMGREVQKRITILGFTPDFYRYTGAADLVITRAGATTIAELAVQKKATVLIPAPHLTGGHQLKNAAELSKQKAVVVVDNDVKAAKFLEVVSELLENGDRRKELSENLGAIAKIDAADNMAKLLLNVAQEQRKSSVNVG